MLSGTAVCILWLLFLISMTLCAMIPKSAVEKNIKKSADYYSNKYMFQQMTKDENSTIVHNYADLVWLNIAWSQDCEKPFVSAINSAFYEGRGERDMYKSESLIKAVYDGEKPDNSYARYWHGSLIFIKPLLILTDILGIRKINTAVCVLCILTLCILLFKRKFYAVLAGYIVSLAACFVYIIPLCMEYMPTFVLMHITAVLMLLWGYKQKRYVLCAFFASVGTLVCFFDFLTNEILTLFVPLILLICIKEKNNERLTLLNTLLYGGMWLVGYACTWLFKWLMCLVVLGKNAFFEAVSNGAYRMAGAVPDIEQNQFAGAIIKNLNRLFPFNFLSETAVWIAVAAIVFILFCVCFLYRKEKISKSVWLLLLIAAMPYARYICLSNHSCLHPFFTFRTQIITIIALFAAVGYMIDFNLIFKRGKKKCKKKN